MPRQLRKKIASFLIPKEFASKVGESSAGGVWRFFRYSEDLGFKIKFLKAVSESDFCAMITRSSAENITRLLRRFNLATSVAIRQEGERLTSYLDLEKVQFLIGGTDTEGKNKLFSSIALCNNSVARALLKKGLGKEIMCNSTPHDLSLILGHLVEDERLLPVAKDFLSNVCANDWKEKLISASDAGVFWLIWHIYQTDQDLGRKLVQNTYEHLLSLIDIMDAERVGLFGLLVLCEVSIAPYLLSGEHLWSLMNMLKQVKSSTCFFLGLELLKRNLPLPKASGVEEWLVVKADSMAEKLDEAYLVQSMKTRFLEIIKELKAI